MSVDFKKGELEVGIVGRPRPDVRESTDTEFRVLTEIRLMGGYRPLRTRTERIGRGCT
ncbi:uncharacterized protein K452DRAFT_289853 [Aplosporella prunicola CBS 121167]|uniref:Uncharacterized protein n=1 Tax=Aplosporella prunicola CBS 121167 TaxID=1176127 RepID=A0A6A6B5K6_9PEZI|nr:uncharacterized protein K452DRAFT_289853 [Aplosporella prunicola CBS 121167]KAF2139300.1 hypothetical protein K452DRAFT_289853 [Aplosporella prunicola CBS 121167]